MPWAGDWGVLMRWSWPWKAIVRTISVVLVSRKAGHLALADDPERAARLVEEAVGLTAADYRSSTRLRGKLDGYLESLPDLIAAQYVLLLSGALGTVRRQADALRVLEAYFALEEHDYQDGSRVAGKLAARGERLPEDMQVFLLFALSGCLGNNNRGSECTSLLAADLGLDPGRPPSDPEARVEELRLRLARRLTGLHPDVAAAYLQMVVMSLDELGAGDAGGLVWEDHLGLRAEDYRSSERLGAKLSPWLDTLDSPVTAATTVAVLAGHKELTNPEQALALLEWYVGVDPDDYRNGAELARKWQAFCRRQPADVGPTIWRVWAGALTSAHRLDDMVTLMEADSGVGLEDLAHSDRFGPKWAERLRSAQVDTQAAYILSLTFHLVEHGHQESADRVVDWFLRGYANLWEIPAAGDPGVRHVIPLLGRWLEALAHREPVFCWQVCEQAVLYLRHSLLLTDLQMLDRREFIAYVDDLRRRILQVADRWSDDAATFADVHERILQAQLWDAELGQRLRFEEFLLTRVQPIAPASVPEDRWPLTLPEPLYWDSHLPDPDACRDEDVLRLLSPGRWRRASYETDGAAPTATGDKAGAPPAEQSDWLREAEEIVRGGVTEGLLARMLGTSGLLVRAGFRADGALVWAALRSHDGQALQVAAAGVGRTGDLWRLRWAVFRHDVGLLLASGGGRLADVVPDGSVMDARDSLVEVLESVLDTVTDSLVQHAAGRDRTAADWLAEISSQVEALDSSNSRIAGDERLGTRLRDLLNAALEPPWWQDSGALLRDEISSLRTVMARRRQGRASRNDLQEIDDATRAYLADVAGIWSLGPLPDQLRDGDDVVFQLEDALQAVPVAHYPLPDGTPLYARVRSTRVSLSVLMTLLQQRAEQRFATDTRRILAVSYFDEDDEDDEENFSYARWLHHGQRHLARASRDGITCLNAAEDPPAAPGTLRAALESYQAFQTVTVCGHGCTDQAGVKLSGGVWDGTGCDWRAVNLLLLASCSVGRLEQTLDYDVEGLCVQLVLHRARSVLACRWPVITPQAIAFANEVVAQYLDLRERCDGAATSAENLRARAVNAARHRFLRGGDSRAPGEIAQLNTVAAFELYGLG